MDLGVEVGYVFEAHCHGQLIFGVSRSTPLGEAGPEQVDLILAELHRQGLHLLEWGKPSSSAESIKRSFEQDLDECLIRNAAALGFFARPF